MPRLLYFKCRCSNCSAEIPRKELHARCPFCRKGTLEAVKDGRKLGKGFYYALRNYDFMKGN